MQRGEIAGPVHERVVPADDPELGCGRRVLARLVSSARSIRGCGWRRTAGHARFRRRRSRSGGSWSHRRTRDR
jgi:hypothetical protein